MTFEEVLAQPISRMTPHKAPMLLLDRAVAMDEEAFESELTLGPDSPFCEGGEVGAWVGIEYMAQTVAAFAGAEALRHGKPVNVGFLLGTRRYECAGPAFKAGLTLRVRVQKVLHDPSGLSVVDSEIRDAATGASLAKASLTVFEVGDLDAYLREHHA